jgi:hypothetical protein
LLISEAMVFAVMRLTERHSELVTHLKPHAPRLRKSEVVGFCEVSPQIRETGLRRYEFEVSLIAEPTRLTDCQHAFVDPGGSGIVLNL